MRKPEQSSEPSIEEILASIRKIIADDSTQQSTRAAALTDALPEASPRQVSQDARRQTSHAAPAFYAEAEEPVAAMGEDDILELTEDSMLELEEPQAQSPILLAEEPAAAEMYHAAAPAHHESLASGSRSAPPSGEELESVLSNVVAEVKRLAGVPKSTAEIAAPPKSDWAEPLMPSVPASLRKSQPVDRWDSPAPQSEAVSGPAAAAPAARQPQQSRPASKPVWSARHLDGDPQRPPAAPSDARQRAQSSSANLTMSGPENWADGVQMPVPENGPAAPFPEPETDETETAPPVSGSGEAGAEIEREKTFVGEMLTRVFGGTPKKAPEASPPPSHATPQLAKAEDLAKATIADFASDKLRAPAVAQALHADKPFMDAITNSLETAMADRNAAAGRPASASSIEDEFPEMLLPADDEGEAFDAPASRPSSPHAGGSIGDLLASKLTAASARAAPAFAEEPELPRDLPEDLLPQEIAQSARHAAVGNLRASGELHRAAAVAPAPSARTIAEPEPTQRVKAISPQMMAAGSDMLAFAPALEDSIKELIKPLIVQWLNDNLPRIVEKAVREEIAVEGLVSRARGEGGFRR